MNCSEVNISVVICTRNRAESLSRTLAALQQHEWPDGMSEVVVVDNGSTDGTKAVLEQEWKNVRLHHIFVPRPGKSLALNGALEVVKGRLIVFTDDDISPRPGWIASLSQAAEKYKNAALFCGPITPVFPAGTPSWFASHPAAGAFFGRFEFPLSEGPLPPNILPVGGNFAARRNALRGLKFRLDLGPSEENGMMLGEDTDFTRRIRERSRDCIYIPAAGVLHHIRPEQMSSTWICRRAFNWGRSVILRRNAPVIVQGFESNWIGLDSQGRCLDQACLIHYYCGQFSAGNPNDAEARLQLESILRTLAAIEYQDLLIPEARQVCVHLFGEVPISSK
jgi:glycosyltransferase involved in cell wall biosynthesis